jgi:exopolyphosphatase/guanosine-5'-triphosphate,3'-diphosphate pyrophosphatase
VKRRILAGVDVGTNTFRILIAEVNKSSIRELYSDRIITRIGSWSSGSNLLTARAIEAGTAALAHFRRALSDFRVEAVYAVGTSALREAKNSDEFIRRVQRETGFHIRIISGDEEAALTSLGVLYESPFTDTIFLADIGGGSTELIHLHNKQLVASKSIRLGVVSLADRYMRHDPPQSADINSMKAEIREAMDLIKKQNKPIPPDTVFIGTGGSVTTLSAMAQGLSSFESSKIHHSSLSIETVMEISSNLSDMSSYERREKYPALEINRLDIIVPGVLILHEMMMTFGWKQVIVSDYGLREGLLIRLYNRLEADPMTN